MTQPLAWAGQSSGWRYLAQRIDGTGNQGVFLHNELPLTGVKFTDVLSGPPQLQADVSPVYLSMLADDGQPLLTPWSTAIYAECDGVIRGGGLLVDSTETGPTFSIDCSGFCGYAKNLEFPGAVSYTQVDALDLVRIIWATIQGDSASNLGLQVNPTTKSGILIGTQPATNPDGTPATSTSGVGSGATSSGPYNLNWWSTTDLGGEIDKLAASTPFDYHERHVWNASQTGVNHYLDFGYPSYGQRRDYLRFVEGENIQTLPQVTNTGSDFANHVVVLGAGEGSARIRAEARAVDGRLRRTETIDDSSITDVGDAAQTAQLELRRRKQLTKITSVVLRNTSSAPFGSFGVGDEIRIQADPDWGSIDMWCRVTSLQVTPDVPDLMTASLVRSDWVPL